MADLTIADVRSKYPQYADMSDNDLVNALHQKFYSDMPMSQFQQKVGYTPPPPPAPAAPLPPETVAGDVGGSLISSVLNIPHGLAHAAVDLARRTGLSNTPVGAPDPGFVQGMDMSNPASIATAAHIAANPVVQHVAGAVNNVVQAVPAPVRNAAGIASDVGQLAAPAIPGASMLRDLTGGAEAAEAAATPAYRLGLRNAEGHPVAKFVAGDSGQGALIENNSQAANVNGLSVAGITPGTKPTAEAFEAARAAPDSVYQRAAASVPTTPFSPETTSAINSAGGVGQRITTGSPDAAGHIADLKSQLLAPDAAFSGDQVLNEIRGLRQEGFQRITSEDPSSVALGKAQLQISSALEDHLASNLPTNAPVSADQLTAARTALAQNHTVQGVMHGDDLDLAKLGRVGQNNPGLLTGPLADMADFAQNNGAVVGLPSKKYYGADMAGDIGKAGDKTILSPNAALSALGNIFGLRPAARAALTGGARDLPPVTGLGGEFDELPMSHLTAPPGSAGAPYQPDLGNLPQGPGSRGSLDLTPPPGVLEPYQRSLGDEFTDHPSTALLGQPGGAMGQGLGSRGNLELQPPPGSGVSLSQWQRLMDLGDELVGPKKTKGK